MIDMAFMCHQFIIIILIFREAMYCVCGSHADAATKPNILGLVPGSFMVTINFGESIVTQHSKAV